MESSELRGRSTHDYCSAHARVIKDRYLEGVAVGITHARNHDACAVNRCSQKLHDGIDYSAFVCYPGCYNT